MGRVRGIGMVEAVVSIFLLSTVVIMVFTLLNTSLRYQGQAQRRAIAAMLGKRTMDEVRGWAWQATDGTLNFLGDWAAYDGQTFGDPNHPEYIIEVDVEPGSRPLFSPNQSLESDYGGRAKRMNRSLVPISVKVRWKDGITPQELELFSYIGEPPRAIARVEISRTSGPADPIPREGVIELSAQAFDAGDQPMDDVMFRWYVEPTAPNPGDDPGLGTLIPPWGPPTVPPIPATPRHGRQAALKHAYIRSDGVTWGHSDGLCRVIAVATAQGQECRGELVVNLAP